MSKALHLANRSVIKLSGADSKSFLQGIITNDITHVSAETALYAGLLTPQGKFLFDMLIIEANGALYLDVEAARKDDLVRRLMMYRLRAAVEIEDLADTMQVWASDTALSGTDMIVFQDPRHADLGFRLITSSAPSVAEWPLEAYETLRLALGVPDGSRDMMVEKYFWLETNAEALNGVSFTKGCFVGQELTARMKHRTTLKKTLLPVMSNEGSIAADSAVINAAGKEVGHVHTSAGKNALAYLRLDRLEDDLPLMVGDTEITPVTQRPQ